MRSIVRHVALPLLAGLSSVVLPICPTSAQTLPAARTASADPYANHIAEASQRFGIPAAWIRAVMRAESAGDPRAVSPKGAIGLMQIMPATWAALRIRHHLGTDPYDPRDNILAGAAFLRELYDRYGNVAAMLAAYNAGPGRYEASLAGRPLPAETRAYVFAIGPSVDGSTTTAPVMVAAADPLAWTGAPLFIAQPDRTSVVDPASSERRATDVPTACDVSAIEPRSRGLFVARAAAEPRP